MSEWISVKERLPENGTKALVAVVLWNGRRFIDVDIYYKEEWAWDGRFTAVTHWRPLLESPREDDAEWRGTK